MFMDIIGIDLFDQNVNMIYTEVRLRCFWILHCTGIDLFDQNVEMGPILRPKLHFRTRFSGFRP